MIKLRSAFRRNRLRTTFGTTFRARLVTPYEVQLTTTEEQLCTNQVRLDQSHAHEGRLGDETQASEEEQTKGLLSPTLDHIKAKMNRDQGNNSDDDDDKEDSKPTAQEKKQAEEAQDTSDSDDDGPTQKRRKKSFSLGCEVLHQHIKFDGEE